MSRRSDARRGPLEDLNEARYSAPPVAGDPVAELELILERVRRLRYDHNNPERFHAERSDVAGAIGGLLKRMRAHGQPIGAVVLPERMPPERRDLSHLVSRSSSRERRPILHLKGDHAARV